MSCESFLEKLDLFLDHEAGRHELPPGVVGELRHHLASCRLCRWEVSRAISLSTAVRSLPDRTPPVAEPPHSRRRARPVRAGGPRGRRFRSRLPSVAAAITLVAASVGLLGLFGRFGTGEREDFDRPGSAALARSGWEARGLEVVEGRDRGGGSSREAAIGTRLRAVDPDASLVASCGTGLHCRRGATLRVSPSDAVRLVEGEMLAERQRRLGNERGPDVPGMP